MQATMSRLPVQRSRVMGISLNKDTKTEGSDSVLKANDLLPLHLKDLCLLKVINDLDSYPVGLLSSLPRWLRLSLLDNISVIDLCRFDCALVDTRDNTIVDVDLKSHVHVEEIWKSRSHDSCARPRLICGIRMPLTSMYTQQCSKFRNGFDLDDGSDFERRSAKIRRQRAVCSRPRSWQSTKALSEELQLVLNAEDNEPLARRKFILELAAVILSSPLFSNISNRVTSISGVKLLQNLLPAQSTSITAQLSNDVWRKQPTALKVKDVARFAFDESVWLTPHRINFKNDSNLAVKLFLLLSDYCPQPATVNLHVSNMSQQIHQALYTARFAQEYGSRVSTLSKMCTTTMNFLLRRVKILKLGCDGYSSVGIMTSMIEAATLDGNECKLQCLFCFLTNLFADLAKPLSSVFFLPNFRHLIVRSISLYMPSLRTLLLAFLTSPCSNKQQLSIEVDKTPDELDFTDLAKFDMSAFTIPPCAIEHKVLHPMSDDHRVLHLLLQLSTIQLHELHIDGVKYVKLCSLHPDLKVVKLFITVKQKMKYDPLTCQDDIVRLLVMPELQEISISGQWRDDVKHGLIEGFRKRAQLLPILRKISIKLYSEIPDDDYRQFWNVIFSLPQVDQLEMSLGVGFTDVRLIHKSWVETTVKTRLKSLRIIFLSCEDDVDLLQEFTQEYFIEAKNPKINCRSPKVVIN